MDATPEPASATTLTAELPPLEFVTAAYLSGHVPYGILDEIVWRIPAPRFCLDLRHARLPKDVLAKASKRNWRPASSTAFEEVVAGCAEAPRTDDSRWLTPTLTSLYCSLRQAGLARSFEIWDGDDLVAGEFGIVIAGIYFCESKFHTANGAGSYCTAVAVGDLAADGFTFYDAQYGPEYLRRFSTRGLEPFGPDVFAEALSVSASRRFQQVLEGGMPF